MNENIAKALAVLPDKPGVYLMHDANGKVIYVGKAVVLKNRVRSYFRNLASHTVKVKALVSKVAEIETIVTDSEVEALILECNLIKKYRPRYNIMLKDDKTYPYLKVTMAEDFPRIYVTRRLVRDGSKYYGPYADAGAMHATVKLLRSMFPAQHVSAAHLPQNESGTSLFAVPHQTLPCALCGISQQGRIRRDDTQCVHGAGRAHKRAGKRLKTAYANCCGKLRL